jgi:hypothetical protein
MWCRRMRWRLWMKGGANTSRRTCSCSLLLTRVEPHVFIWGRGLMSRETDWIGFNGRIKNCGDFGLSLPGPGLEVRDGTRKRFSGIMCRFCSNLTCGVDVGRWEWLTMRASLASTRGLELAEKDDINGNVLVRFLILFEYVTLRTPMYLRRQLDPSLTKAPSPRHELEKIRMELFHRLVEDVFSIV